MAIGLCGPVLCATAAESSATGNAESPSTPSNTAAVAPKSGIDSAKREFEAMKASRDPAQRDQRAALPGVSVPQLHVEERSPTPAILPGKNAKQDPTAKKSANWLIEAMDKDAAVRNGKSERGERERNSGRRSSDEEREAGAVSRSDLTSERARVDSAVDQRKYDDEAASRKRAAEPTNPLTRYLEGWITPKDYAVLRSSLEESLGGRPADGGAGFAISGATGGAVDLGGRGGPMAISDAAKTVASPIPRENPYLEAMQARPELGANAPAFAVPPPSATPQPQLAPPASIAAPVPPVVAPAKSKIPEFAKPQQDEKYFKQLKRF